MKNRTTCIGNKVHVQRMVGRTMHVEVDVSVKRMVESAIYVGV
jgi:hypothetical protein